MNRKGLFIGLGGAGVSTVAHIKANLKKHYQDDILLNRDNSFLCIDTDKTTISKLNDTPGLRGIINEQTEFIDLGDANPYQIYKSVETSTDEKRKSAFEDWSYMPGTWDNVSLSEGAKADRQQGRSALFLYSGKITSILGSKIENLRTIQDTEFETTVEELFNDLKKTNTDTRKNDSILKQQAKETAALSVTPLIWVYSSSCGGTGSSLLLDMLYFIDRIYQSKYPKFGEAYVKLFLYMPRPFIDKNLGNPRYPLNPFAIFNEINQMFIDHRTEGKKIFESINATPIDPIYTQNTSKISPFRYIIPIDSMIGVNSVPLDNLPEVTAKLSTYLHVGSAEGKVLSVFDNEIKNIYGLPTYITKDSENQILWHPYLVGAGFRRIIKPNQDLIDYIKVRLNYEILEYGLLGPEFSQIHSDEKQRIEKEKSFAKMNIYKYVTKEDSIQNCSNLYRDYKKLLYDGLGIENESIIIDESQKKDLQAHTNIFLDELKIAVGKLKNKWDIEGSGLSKSEYLKKIMDSTRLNAEATIKQFGLRYTFDLIRRIDDNECTDRYQRFIGDRIKYSTEKILAIESEINKFAKEPKKYWDKYRSACFDYANLLLDQQLTEFQIEILFDLINEKNGLLEVFRKKGSEKMGGLQGYIDIVTNRSSYAKDEYTDLAKRFKLTSQDLATDYVPSLSALTSSDNSWITNNEFSELYNQSIVNKDSDLINQVTGDPIPIRNSTTNNKNLHKIIGQLWDSVLKQNDSCYFCNEVNISRMADQNAVLSVFLNKIDNAFIDQLKGTDSILEQWLGQSLETYIKSNSRLLNHVQENMKNHTDIMFDHTPTIVDSERLLFVGQSTEFAQKFGYLPGGALNDFLPSHNSNNSFYKIRLLPGFTFQSYSQYSMLSSIYGSHKRGDFPIYFPHISKELKSASMKEIFESKFKKTANTKIKDFLFLFYIEALRKALKESNMGLFEHFFTSQRLDINSDGGLSSLLGQNKSNEAPSGLFDLSSDSESNDMDSILGLGTDKVEMNQGNQPHEIGFINIDIQNANGKITLKICDKIEFSNGLIELANTITFDVDYNQPSAVDLFIKTIEKYQSPEILKNQILDCISEINISSKTELKNFILKSEANINKKLLEILTKPLWDNHFLKLERDLNFIKILFGNLKGILQQIIYKLN